MDSVVHFEIPASDIRRAAGFYSKVFGWDIDKVPGGMEYHIATTAPTGKDRMLLKPGAINGAIMERDDQAKSPIVVISVQSIDRHMKRIKDAGGKEVIPKQKVMAMGYYARIQDTEGNIIGLWENIMQEESKREG